MTMNVNELDELFNKIIEIINKNFEGERKDKLLNMYETLQERIMLAPASHNKNYFGAYPGGYMIHTLRVIDIVQYMYKLWQKMGGDMNIYTHEEMMFSALNHAIGKLGDDINDLYVPNTNDWMIKNKGDIYMFNPDVIHMTLPDRAIWLLQKFGIEMTQNEYIAIKTYEGMLNVANDAYYKTNHLNSHLPILLHQANYMAYRIAHETDLKE
jgi:hypothetical protein